MENKEQFCFDFTFKYSNYKIITPSEAYKELLFLLNSEHLNDSIFDLINYEKLIYYEINFQDQPQIMILIDQLKHKIANNWLKKQQLLNRLI